MQNQYSNKITAAVGVIPFFVYAGISFLLSCILLFTESSAFRAHFFSPSILAVTHLMALGWGSMIIFGASHQIVPILENRSLHSTRLAIATLLLTGLGIPLLIYGFYSFQLGWPAKWGGRLILLGIICYLINIIKTVNSGEKRSIYNYFILTASIWLFLTAFYGLALVYNFTFKLFPKDFLHYLPLHAHSGIVGWFTLLVTGVGARLLPMFIVSSYHNDRLLWWVFGLLNSAVICYILFFHLIDNRLVLYLPVLLLITAYVLFTFYCIEVYRKRIVRKLDDQVKLALLSFFFMGIVNLLMLSLVILVPVQSSLVLTYGFLIFFGWLSTLIIAMTFRTLPVLVWNQKFARNQSLHLGNPKTYYSSMLYKIHSTAYLIGFLVFASGILFPYNLLLHTGAILMILGSAGYNINIWKVLRR